MSGVATANGWETRHFAVEGRAEVTEDRKIRGYAIVFNVLSEDLGGFRERVKPSAVDRTLREGLDVRAYFNHDPDKVLGRTRAGTLRLFKDPHGLKVEIHPPKTTLAKELMVSIERGDISGMSFRFRTIEDEWNIEEGQPVRSLIDTEIGEVSVVTEPAYQQTDVAVRSLQEFHEEQRKTRQSIDWHLRRLRATSVR